MTNELMKHKKLSIVLRPEAKKWIVRKTCLDRSYGARPLRRAIQKYIEDPLSEAIIQNQIKPDSVLEIYVDDDSLHYFCVDESTTSGAKLGELPLKK
jgi:ATP-dependent Clp protease ATP-binding subunit ClpC